MYVNPICTVPLTEVIDGMWAQPLDVDAQREYFRSQGIEESEIDKEIVRQYRQTCEQ